MKIGNPNEKPIAAAAPVAAGRAQATGPGRTDTAATPPADAEASTQVALSSAATQLMSGIESVAGDFDTEKVSRIAQAIADGKFQVNAGAIADKLLANAQEVLGKSQH